MRRSSTAPSKPSGMPFNLITGDLETARRLSAKVDQEATALFQEGGGLLGKIPFEARDFFTAWETTENRSVIPRLKDGYTYESIPLSRPDAKALYHLYRLMEAQTLEDARRSLASVKAWLQNLDYFRQNADLRKAG